MERASRGTAELRLPLDRAGIESILPHREPFLMIDSVVSAVPGRVVAKRLVRPDEPCFRGHFPGNPVFPGVLQIEAMAQTMAVLMVFADESLRGRVPVFLGTDDCRFRKPVFPGDELEIEVETVRMRGNRAACRARISRGGETVSEALLRAAMMERTPGPGGTP